MYVASSRKLKEVMVEIWPGGAGSSLVFVHGLFKHFFFYLDFLEYICNPGENP